MYDQCTFPRVIFAMDFSYQTYHFWIPPCSDTPWWRQPNLSLAMGLLPSTRKLRGFLVRITGGEFEEVVVNLKAGNFHCTVVKFVLGSKF